MTIRSAFNYHTGHPRFHFDEAGAGGGDGGAAAAAAAAAAAKPWHQGLDAEVLGAAQRKGWDLTDPAKAFAAAATAYSGAERMIGAPPEKMLRMPEASADPTVLDAFWQKLGAAKEAKDIDFSTIKGADGKPLDERMAESIRKAAIAGRIPKDGAVSFAGAVQKHLDDVAAEQNTVRTAAINEDKAALDKNWGANKEANLFIANQALEKIAVASGIPVEKAKEAWDALSKVGGIGASTALEMLRVVGVRMGEDRFVKGGGPNGELPMTREAAKSEIAALKADAGFRDRLLKGDVEADRKWKALHKIGYAEQAA